MSDEAATLLATLPGWAFGFVLVMARVGAAIMLLPGLGEAEPPAMVRVGLALGVTALLLPGIEPTIPAVPEAGLQAGFMIGAEVTTGLWLGWLARLLVLALPVAGQFIAYMLGVANVLQPDPELGGQATPIARLFALAAPLAILVTGLYAVPLAALAGSSRGACRQLSTDTGRHAAARGGCNGNRRPRGGGQLRAGDPSGLAFPAREYHLACGDRAACPAGASAPGLLRRHARTDPRRHGPARRRSDSPPYRLADSC